MTLIECGILNSAREVIRVVLLGVSLFLFFILIVILAFSNSLTINNPLIMKRKKLPSSQ